MSLGESTLTVAVTARSSLGHEVRPWAFGLVLATIAWLPLLLLSLHERRFTGFPGAFAYDVGAHVRFLFSLAVLWRLRPFFDERVQSALEYLREAKLIDGSTAARIQTEVSPMLGPSCKKRFYVAALLLGYAMTGGGYVARRSLDTWQSLSNGSLSLAGLWRAFASAPLSNAVFVFCAMRIVAWATVLLRSIRRMTPIPTHPDRHYGLFVATRVAGDFAPFLFVVSAMFAAALWTNVHRGWHTAAELGHAAAAFVVLAPLPVVLPLVVFAVPLMRARRRALRTYAVAVARISRSYEAKLRVLEGDPRVTMDGDAFSWDADMGGSFERLVASRVIPIPRGAVLALYVATFVPMLVLLFASLPVDDALRALGRLKDLFV